MGELAVRALGGLPEIGPGDDLAAMIVSSGGAPGDEDVVVVAHKAVSKAEGRVRELSSIDPSRRAIELGQAHGKDPRHVQAILDESVELLRAERGVLIVRTRHGFVCANAGVDESNTAADGDLVLLPLDPDASARALRARLHALCGHRPAVLISDSFGRAWRRGTCGIAIGAAGLPSLIDLRGQPDLFGRTLEVSIIGFADEIAAAASLLQGQAAEAQPVVLVRGLDWTAPIAPAAELVRPLEEDLFR
jgi:coenzyme F420-0:L-glutamate ligase / coenzyme F420-1:gamma-L-glutamate ligase